VRPAPKEKRIVLRNVKRGVEDLLQRPESPVEGEPGRVASPLESRKDPSSEGERRGYPSPFPSRKKKDVKFLLDWLASYRGGMDAGKGTCSVETLSLSSYKGGCRSRVRL